MFSSAPRQLDIEKVTEGLPPWASVLVIVCLAIIALAVALPKVLPMFKDEKPEKADKGSSATGALTTTAVTLATEQSNELVTRIVARLEDRLDEAHAEMARLRVVYDAQLNEMREQMADAQKREYELAARIMETQRQLEAAQEEARRLRWQLEQLQNRGEAFGGPK